MKSITKLLAILIMLSPFPCRASDRCRQFSIWPTTDSQEMPAIDGDTVVWQDNRDGNWQIYAVVLDGPKVAYCRTRAPGDVNGDCKVDFDDFTIMAANWLECHLEPPEACPSY